MHDQNFEIDLVYLWVDGDDPHWLAKKQAFMGKAYDDSEINSKGRYSNNDELKYSLRSVEKHMPWIRRIFIITDEQSPDWLDTSHPKIQLVDHREILPLEALPSYNAFVIEYFLHKIHGLAEHFLFANDDMFFNADLSPDFFFASDGYPIVRLLKKPLGKWRYRWKRLVNKSLSNYRQTIFKVSQLIENKFGKFYSGIPHHNVDAYRKSDYQVAVEQVFKNEIKPTISNHIRSSEDIQRVAFLYYALAIGHGQLKYVGKNESCVIDLDKSDYGNYLKRYRSKLFCMNDNQHVTDNDRVRAKLFLGNLFPLKSAFEL